MKNFTNNKLNMMLRCIGIALSAIGWSLVLLSFALFIMAAIANNDGELGQGLLQTSRGVQSFAFGVLIGSGGIVLWVKMERRFQADIARIQNVETLTTQPSTPHRLRPSQTTEVSFTS